jgi:YebC/PmpR family DNA-binding regulatory protein
MKSPVKKLNRFKSIIIGGASASTPLLEKVKTLSCDAYATYGMTETVSHIALQKLNGSDAQDYFEAFPDVKIKTDERDCLVIELPDFSEPIITNDIVKIIHPGGFKIFGRYDNIINSGGVKLMPETIEKKIEPILKQPFFVSGIQDDRLGQKLVLIVEGYEQPGLLTALKLALPTYEIPRDIFYLDQFIRTETQKINRPKTLEKASKKQGINLFLFSVIRLFLHPQHQITMGRVFEKRKHTMFARFDRMAKAFTRIGKDIALAVKQNGPNPDNNPKLRMAIQNAKGVNMPKDRVEAAIKRASSKEEKDYTEVIYEGYAPHGVPVLVLCATDNPTRTVANVRLQFSKNGGTMGNSGTVLFMFEHRGVFKFDPAKLNLDEMELDLIDAGAEDIERGDDEIVVHTKFTDFGHMQKFLEEKKIDAKSSELQYIPNTTKELPEDQQDEVLKLIEAIEADDDVQTVFHNLA